MKRLFAAIFAGLFALVAATPVLAQEKKPAPKKMEMKKDVVKKERPKKALPKRPEPKKDMQKKERPKKEMPKRPMPKKVEKK